MFYHVRWVARSMAAGAAWDALFGIAILFFDAATARLLGLALPEDPVYLHLVGVLLLLLAALYLLPAANPERYRGVVVVAAGGRLAGFAFLTWVGLERPDGLAFLLAGAVDLILGVLHGALLVRAQVSDSQRS
jgi:hypothetical protein